MSLSICRSCRALLRTPLARRLHLWQPPNSHIDLSHLISEEVTHLSVGVGFAVAYAPFQSSTLWVFGDGAPLVCGERGSHCVQLSLASSAAVREVSSGRAHTAILTTEGEVFSMGMNCYGQRGTSCTDDNIFQAHRLKLPFRMSKVQCGLDHTLFQSPNGRLFACGWSADGQTGIGHYESVSKATEVAGQLRTMAVSSVFTCADTSFALTTSNEVYGWGNTEYGQLGIVTPHPQVCVPAALDCSRLDGQVITIATGGAFTAFLTTKGSVYCVGYGIGEEGSGDRIEPSSLCQFRKLHEGVAGTKAVSIQAGLHYLAIHTEIQGKVTIWGRLPSMEQSSCGPLELQVPSDARYLACGPDQIMALLP